MMLEDKNMRVSEDKANFSFNLLKELGYLLLLVVFFIGILAGSLHLKMVDDSSFSEYEQSLRDTLEKVDNNDFFMHSQTGFYQGLRIILFYWIVGMSIVGTPILIGYLGYKGYSLGYTLSTVIKLMGVSSGNRFIFKYLFVKNASLIFIMILLANFSLKVAKNFFEKKTFLKEKALQYTLVSILCFVLWLILNSIEKMLLTTF